MILRGEVAYGEAAQALDLSVRQMRRVVAAFAAHGVAGIVHGNRGRPPSHTLDAATRELIVARLQGPYAAMNDCHATTLLAERDGLVVSRSTVRRLRAQAQLPKPRTRRPPKHRSRRERMPRAGMLVQIDGSHHRWFGPDHPTGVLLAAIDDATGTVVAAQFREREDAAGYLTLIQHLVTTWGRPEAVYHDGHGIFAPTAKTTASLAEQVANRRTPTQVGRALIELDIRAIRATSPQAKGRIERLFGTLQDRLVNEFALDGITTLAAAQAALPAFLARFNATFPIAPADPVTAWRPLDQHHDLYQICAFAYARTVAADNTVQLHGQTLQLAPAPDRASFARCHVQLRSHLDGAVTVWWNHRRLLTTPAPATTPQLRALTGTRVDPFAQRHDPEAPATIPIDPEPVTAVEVLDKQPWKPAKDHPWKKSFKLERTFSRNS